jgi:hypothetical protein
MSYVGGKFPEGINQEEYIEVTSIASEPLASCPFLRKTFQRILSANNSTSLPCDGCRSPDAVRIVLNIDTERIFVRRDSPCIASPKSGNKG